MIIICPSCQTRYQIDAKRIGAAARSVRCHRCKHHWKHPGAPEADLAKDKKAAAASDDAIGTAEEPVIAASTAAADRQKDQGLSENGAGGKDAGDTAFTGGSLETPNLPALADEPEPDTGGWLKWVLLLAVIIAAGAALYFYRVTVVTYWPPAQQLYQHLGVVAEEPPMHGLDVENVRYEYVREGGKKVMIVRGDAVNHGARKKDLPRLRVALIDADGTEIFYWTVTTAKSELSPGESVPFSTRLPNPPERARNLVVTFIVN